MSDRTLEARIKGVVDASVAAAFATVSNGAAKMGASVAAAGKTSAQGLAAAEAGTSRLRTAYKNLEGAGTALGRVSGALGETLGEIARFGAEAGASQARLETAIDNTGKSWENYSAQLTAVEQRGHDLAFSHESVENALANLVTITKDTGLAMKDLGLAEDIARARGIDLSSAALAVGRAQEGNAAALTRLGFVVDKTKTSEEQLAAVQQQVAGQSEAFAGTTAGAIGRMQDSIHMFLAEVGNSLGPFQSFIALLPGLSVGSTLISGAMGHLAEVFLRDEVAAHSAAASSTEMAAAQTAAAAGGAELAASQTAVAASSAELAAAETAAAAGGVELAASQTAVAASSVELAAAETAAAASTVELAAAQDISAASSAGLIGAIGPGGLVIAAAAATVGIYLLVDALTTDFGEATSTTAGQVQSLSDAIAKLGASGDPFSLQAQAWRSDLEGVSGVLGHLGDTLESLSGQINQKTLQVQGGMDPAFVPQVQAEIDALQQQYDAVANLTSVFGSSQAAVVAFGAAEESLKLITLDTGVGAQKMRDDVTALFQAFDASPKAAADIKVLFDGLDNIAGRIPEYDAYVTAMAQSAKDHATALGLESDALGELGNAFGALKPQLADTANGQQLLDNIQTVATQGTAEQKKVLADLYAQYVDTGNGLDGLIGMSTMYAGQINKETAAVQARTQAGVARVNQIIAEMTAQEKASGDLAAFDKFIEDNNKKRIVDIPQLAGIEQDYQNRRIAGMNQELDLMAKQAEAAHQLNLAREQTVTPSGIDRGMGRFNQLVAKDTADKKNLADYASRAQQRIEIDAKATGLHHASTLAFIADLEAQTKAAIAFVAESKNTAALLAGIDTPGGMRPSVAAHGNDLAVAKASIDGVFGVIAQGTDALAQSSQQVQDWSKGLADASDGASKLDDAYRRGTIDLTQYNRAVMASTSITRNDAAAQEDILKIQAMQLPLLAKQEQAYRQHLDTIAGMSGQEQEIALAFADQGEQAKIASAYATAYSASLGEIPPKVASKIIIDQAQSDPILKDVLEKYGLIKVGADGKITVDFPDKETMTEAIDKLTGSITLLAASLTTIKSPDPVDVKVTVNGTDPSLFKLPPLPSYGQGDGTGDFAGANYGSPGQSGDGTGGQPEVPSSKTVTIDLGGNAAEGIKNLIVDIGTIPPSTTPVVDLQDNATAPVSGITVDIGAIPDHTAKVDVNDQATEPVANITIDLTNIPDATPTISVNDYATGPINDALNLLAAFNGFNAAATITTTYQTVGSPPGGGGPGSGFLRLGGVAGYAQGGVIAELAEAGPELIHLAHGGMAMAWNRGLYNLTRGDYVDTAPTTHEKMNRSRGGGGFTFNNYGDIHGFPDLDTFFAAAEQAARSHFKGLGA